jgi:hypothetical protein
LRRSMLFHIPTTSAAKDRRGSISAAYRHRNIGRRARGLNPRNSKDWSAHCRAAA